MRDEYIQALVWIAVACHGLVAFLVLRNLQGRAMLVGLNAVVGAAVLAYWVDRWYGYAFQGIRWYWNDQLFPLYAVGVLVVCLLYALGKGVPGAVHWLIFCIHVVVLLLAALYFSLGSIDRLW